MKILFFILLVFCQTSLNAFTPQVIFIEKANPKDLNSKEYIEIKDPMRLEKLKKYSDNEAAKFAYIIFDLAIKTKNIEKFPFYISIEEDGNYADYGFKLKQNNGGWTQIEKPFVKLAENQRSLSVTLLHETGHMIFYMLASDLKNFEQESIASIPHSTYAITDRLTALNEGFAQHLETVFAHYTQQAEIQKYYQHKNPTFSNTLQPKSEYFFPINDYLTFSQSWARYQDVKDNQMSFQSAHKRGSYLKIQLDKARDYEQIASADQLLATEGFIATFFFRLAEARLQSLEYNQLEAVYTPFFESFIEVFKIKDIHLLKFVGSYQKGKESNVLEMLFDLSHGVFFDSGAQMRWKKFYEDSLAINFEQFSKNMKVLVENKQSLLENTKKNPQILEQYLGVVLVVKIPQVKIELFGQKKDLSFDLNTVQEGVLNLVPNLSASEVATILTERQKMSFKSMEDFIQRTSIKLIK